MIAFDHPICGALEAATYREWLETNGLGGFASSTICGMNSRRYHGLLVAALNPPVGRAVLLSKLEETLVIRGQRFDLGVNQYPGTVHPSGNMVLEEFRLDPFPTFTYKVSEAKLEKRVVMAQGENTTVIRYELKGDAPADVALELRPLIAFRDYHSTTHENGALHGGYELVAGNLCFTPYQGMPSLYLAHNAASIAAEGHWYRRFQLERERERGLDSEEDLFNPVLLTFDVSKTRVADVVASTKPHDVTDAAGFERSAIARRKAIIANAPAHDEFTEALCAAADQFIVARGNQHTVIAGYPWFGDWGRDTMIALPGLTLLTGRTEIARSILVEFSKHVSQGMLPNRFPDSGEAPEYNTVDATLWYFEAIRAYEAQTADEALMRELYPLLAEIIDWHVKGTRHGIHLEEASGLLNAGEAGVQLTWMDAKVGDWVVTPRIGKPIEIQALWYNALRIMQGFAARLGDVAARKRFDAMATLTRQSFNRVFWNAAESCLYDVVNGVADGSIRPNQIFAVSLPHAIIAPDKAAAIVEKVEHELLTPMGLRTLSARDPKYVGHYGGDQRQRDGAYHQGTVWPWLLGPFVRAYLKVKGNSPEAREQARKWLEPVKAHLSEAGLGTISEIFDGDAPHKPAGCYAQAWSVAEVLRAWMDCSEAAEAQKPVARGARI